MGKRDKDLETEQDTQRQKHTQTTWTGISEGKLVMDDVLQSDCFIHQFNTNTQLEQKLMQRESKNSNKETKTHWMNGKTCIVRQRTR